MAGAIHTGLLAAKPAAFFVVPDPLQPLVASATQEAGPYPGTVSGGYHGHLAPTQSGDAIASTVNTLGYVYSITRAGGAGSAEFVFRPNQSSGFANFRGKDDQRHWWGFHSPITSATPGSDNCALVYQRSSGYTIAFGCTTTTGYIYLRNVNTDRYDQWTLAYSFAFQNTVTAAGHGASLLELPDGSIMLLIRTSAGNDFDVYQHSGDISQDEWILVSRSVLARFNGATIAQQTASQVRMARSGEWIRAVFADSATAGLLHTMASRDRGMSWQYLGTGPTVLDSAQTDDRVPFDLCGVDESGTFLLMAVSSGTQTTAIFYQASQNSSWSTGATMTRPGAPSNIRAVALCETPNYLQAYIFYTDTTTSTVDGWDMGRGPRAYFTDLQNTTGAGWQWFSSRPINVMDGCEWLPCRLTVRQCGPAICFYGSVKTEAAGTEQSTGSAWYMDDWTERSIGNDGPGAAYSSATSFAASMWDMMWACSLGRPTDGAGTTWTQTTVATGTDVITPNQLTITGAAAADQRYYEHPGAGTGNWHDGGGVVRWMMRLDTGDSTTTADNVAVRIIMANAAGTARRDVSIRISGASVLVRDNVGAADRATVSGLSIDTGSAGAFHEFRLTWGVTGTNGQLAIYNTSTKVWVESGTFSLTSAAAAATSLIRFGHLGQVQATQMQSWWREIEWTTDTEQLNQQTAKVLPATNTQDAANSMFGAICSPIPAFVDNGIHVSWGGVGGGEQDSFNGDIAFTYPKEAVFVDSPRIAWRSRTVTACEIIAWTGYSTFMRWRHDAVAIFNCNNRFVLIDYDATAAFASPTATETIDMTVFDTGTTPLTITSVDGNTIVLTAPSTGFQFVAGELVGFYVRPTNGPASGLTYRVTRHLADGVLQCDAETTITAVAGNTVLIFAPHGVKRFASTPSENYMRIRVADTDTAEGYHQIGTVLLGRALDVSVPLEWAHTDDEQANVTQYRTKGGSAWAFTEGPPQRTIAARVVGDRERWRERFRGLMQQISYEQKPVALVRDSARAPETLMLGRVRSGSTLDNAAYYVDSNGKTRPVGDMSLTFVEEPG